MGVGELGTLSPGSPTHGSLATLSKEAYLLPHGHGICI